MYLSELQKKEIIDAGNGKKVGTIIDVIVLPDGRIKTLTLEDHKGKRFSLKEQYEVSWEQIIKIGDDIILIDSSKK